MNIASTQFSLNFDAFEIYLSGCDGVCSEECHNKELWDFNLGKDYKEELTRIVGKIHKFSLLIKSVWVLGGEPLLQDKDKLIDLLKELKKTDKDITLFTRFELNDIDKEIIELCDYIKCGCYREDLKTDDNIWYGIKLATSNQKIYKISDLVGVI